MLPEMPYLLRIHVYADDYADHHADFYARAPYPDPARVHDR
jgi:hypothetical protein